MKHLFLLANYLVVFRLGVYFVGFRVVVTTAIVITIFLDIHPVRGTAAKLEHQTQNI